MSWLSEATGIHWSAPDSIRKIGDVLGGSLVNAIPGGSIIGKITGASGTGGGGATLQQVANATGANLQAQAQAAVGAAQETGRQQSGWSQMSAGFGVLSQSPFVMLALVLGVVWLLKRRS